ncbi:hypothetical protein CMV_002859 [Castanea mollissima]|uniref:Uncharacterized protein n=1 Tax=Castanea mollissima TaxID=60419 RepID=A0A8J4S0N3_9ROSI|nr:hypothetical protein CMV_002859 [Castanea mollissima]
MLVLSHLDDEGVLHWNSIEFEPSSCGRSKCNGAIGYIGSIGKDKFGEEMTKNLSLAGVNVHYYNDSQWLCLRLILPSLTKLRAMYAKVWRFIYIFYRGCKYEGKF